MGVRSFIGRAIGGFGSAIRKVADFGGHVARKVGEFAAPVGGLAASIADMMGRPDVAAAIGKGTEWLQRFAPRAESILEKAGAVGNGMGGLSKHLLSGGG